MDLLKRLTIKNLRLNKKRTIAIIIGIMLSVALLTAVSTMYSSSIASLIEFETYEKGYFHVAFYDVSTDEINNFKNNRKIDEIFLTQDIGYAKLDASQNEYKPYAFIKAFTKESLDNLSIKLVEGKLPESENEIIIPTHLKTNGRVTLNIGDTITLDIGKRVSDGYQLNQNNSFSNDNSEKIIDTTSVTYKIVGIIERPATNIESYSAPGYTFVTYIDEKNIKNNVDIFCKYTEEGIKDYTNVTANILGISEEAFELINKGEIYEKTDEETEKYLDELSKAKYEYNINTYLIDLQTNPFDNSTVGGLGNVVIIVCAIIIFASVFCIKNSFDISIMEKIKQYGMLKSIGATKKQIRKTVFFEATILGVVGISLGILLGMCASSVLVVISDYFISDMFRQGFKFKLSFSWVAIIFAIILGIITIYLSALKSARKASKVTPIESIKNNKEIKSKKLKTPKIIRRVFGIGGEISYKNLKRSRKKYRTTVISITVSTFVFIALSYFMNMAFDEVRREINLQDYNLSLIISEKCNEQMYEKVLETTKLDNIKNYTIAKLTNCYIKDPKYTKEYKQFLNENEEYIYAISIDDRQFKEYMKELGLFYENAKDKVILIDNSLHEKYDEKSEKYITEKIKVFDYKNGDTIKFTNVDNKEFEMKVGIITDILPFGIDQISDYLMIVSEKTYEKNLKSEYLNLRVYYDSSDSNKLQDDIDEVLNGYSYNVNNVGETVNMMKKLYTLVGIFLYGFIIVITVIGITNIFNAITANMELRKPEFAMLKSIGMTSKEFSRMIRLETVFMGVKSLVFSIPIGILLSYLIYKTLGLSYITDFVPPIKSIIISIVAVFLLITCIMKYAMSKIDKQNTIETIRNENI